VPYCNKCNQFFLGGENEVADHMATFHSGGPPETVVTPTPPAPPGQGGPFIKFGVPNGPATPPDTGQ
jgi:hypothetical protein